MTEKAWAILNDYTDCGTKHHCNECKAHEYINNDTTTYCELLSRYRGRLQDKINEVIEKN